MENSNSYISNSGKTVDNSQINTNFKNRNIKKSIYNFSKKEDSLNLKKCNSSLNIIYDKTPFSTLAKNHKIIKNIYNRFTPSCFRKSNKFANFCIFGKRELAFQKSMEDGISAFKYSQSFGLDKKNNQTILRNKNCISNSLYLTESMIKSTKNKTTLPLIDKDKSVNDEDMSSILQKNTSFTKNIYLNKFNIESFLINIDNSTNNKTNTTKNQNKKSIIFLKKLNLNNSKEHENKKNLLIKKINALENKVLGNKNIKKYIQDFRGIILSKYNFRIKQEKVNIISESLKSERGKTNYKLEDLNSNYKFFMNEFYPKLNEYVKYLEITLEKEKVKNISYLNTKYILQEDISQIKNKIIKFQNEKDYLVKEMFSQIIIQEKKLNLPEYYKDILLNGFSFKQIQKKYGEKVDINEYDRILKYKTSSELIGIDTISDKLKVLTNENINLLNQYNKLNEIIISYKKEKDEAEKELDLESLKEIDDLIIQKEKQLNNITNKCKNTEMILNNLTIKGFKQNYNNDNNKIKHTKLYSKTEIFLKNLNDNLNYEINYEDKFFGKNTEEQLIMENLRKIDLIVSRFLSKYNEEKIKYNEQMKNFKHKFDREKKTQKTKEQRKNIFLKIESEKQKILKKYNKILFLRKRKIDFNRPIKRISFVRDSSKLEEKGYKTDEFLYY